MRWFSLCVALVGCGTSTSGPLSEPPGPPADRRPVASVRVPGTITQHKAAMADATASVDPEGSALQFSWRLIAPDGTGVPIADDGTGRVPLQLTDLGRYELTVQVFDGTTPSEPTRADIEVVPPPEPAADPEPVAMPDLAPLINAGSDLQGELGTMFSLTGSADDPEGERLNHEWVIDGPVGNTGRPAFNSPATTFKPTAPGLYTLTLVTSDDWTTVTDDVTIEVSLPADILPYQVADARYSRPLDRLLLLAEDLPELHIIDPTTGADTVVALAVPGSSLSIAPSGTEAAIGHDGWITVVAVASGSVTATWPVSEVVHPVLHAGSHVYAFNDRGQSFPARVIDVLTGAESLQASTMFEMVVLPSSRAAIYGARNVIPDNIYGCAITAPGALGFCLSGGGREYDICDRIWVDATGELLITGCGTLFHVSDDPDVDMTFADRVTGVVSELLWVDAIAGAPWATITDDDTVVTFLRDTTYSRQDTETLPTRSFAGTAHDTHGEFVFWRSDGTEAYAIARALAANVTHDTTLVTVEAP